MPTAETITFFTLSAIASTLIPLTTFFTNEKLPYTSIEIITSTLILGLIIIFITSIFTISFHLTKHIGPLIILFHLYSAGFTATFCATQKNLAGTLTATPQAIIMLIIALTLN